MDVLTASSNCMEDLKNVSYQMVGLKVEHGKY